MAQSAVAAQELLGVGGDRDPTWEWTSIFGSPEPLMCYGKSSPAGMGEQMFYNSQPGQPATVA